MSGVNWTEAEWAAKVENMVYGGSPPPAKPKPEKRRANKWEQQYAARLEEQKAAGRILWYQFEAMRFRLADGATYKPDYVAMDCNLELIAFEVKGFFREAARVRIKVAADRHPIVFVAVTKDRRGEWVEERFGAERDRVRGV